MLYNEANLAIDIIFLLFEFGLYEICQGTYKK